MKKLLFVLCSIVASSVMFGQSIPKYGIVFIDRYYNCAYKNLSNYLYFYVSPSYFSRSDSFELKVDSPTIIRKISPYKYEIIPIAEWSNNFPIHIYSNGEYDTTLKFSALRKRPEIQILPTSYAAPFINRINCLIDIGNIYDKSNIVELRVISFDFVIRDSLDSISIKMHVIGNKFDDNQINAMRKIFGKDRLYKKFEFENILITDDKFYREKFSQNFN